MENILNNLTIENIQALLALISYVIIPAISAAVVFYKSMKADKDIAEAVTLAVNVLKVEDKMQPNGKFPEALTAKVASAADALQVGAKAKQQVTDIINSGHTADLKIASINGKPIYLGSVLGIGAGLAAALRRLRGK
jgi:hypothetical protein